LVENSSFRAQSKERFREKYKKQYSFYAPVKSFLFRNTVPEFIDPVFTKTSPKRSFSLNRKRAFWLVFTKTGSIISGTGIPTSGSVMDPE
jgi:hypothetical protein